MKNIPFIFGFLLAVGMIGLAGCDTEITPTPTPLPRDLSQPEDLRPSATFLPVAPTEATESFVGRSNPTTAALAAEGEPSAAFVPSDEPVVQPTAVSLPLQALTSDGLLLQIEYYASSASGAPLIMLLHDSGENRQDWDSFAQQLRQTGYPVLIPDVRGYGQSGGEPDAARAVGDLDIILNTIAGFPEVSGVPIILMGTGEGASIALNGCPRLERCRAAIVLSPRLTANTELDAASAVQNATGRSWLWISADDDEAATQEAERLNLAASGDYNWIRYSSGGRGLALLTAQPDLQAQILGWLSNRFVIVPGE